MSNLQSSLLVATLLVGVLALVAVQPSAAIDLRYHWASDVLLLGAITLAARRLPPTFRTQAPVVGVLLLSLILLYWTWQQGVSTWNFIAGVLPASDAAGYYSDAQRILSGSPISDFSSRRPLFAAFLAGTLGLAGNDLQLALVLVTMFEMAALMICIGMLPRGTPYAVITVFVVTLILYYRRFVGTTLTEQLGLAYGMLAFGMLVRGFHDGRRWLIACGIFLLSLALHARAGAFFTLPLLALLAAFNAARPGTLISWRTFSWLIFVAATGFLVNQLVLAYLGGERSAAFSNFSFVLYGLVFGGDWTLAYQQHPELSSLPASAQPEAIFWLAVHHVIDHPAALLLGALKAWVVFLPTAYVFAASHHPMALALLPYFVLSVLAVAGLVECLRGQRDPLRAMILVALMGIFLSVPFVPPWDADQMRAYAATLPFLAWLPALGVAALWPQPAFSDAERKASTESPRSGVKPWVLAAFLLVATFSFALPIWARGRLPVPEPVGASARCPVGETAVAAFVLPGTLREVVASENAADLKSVGKLFLLDPLGGLREAEKLVGHGRLTKAALERNALAEYAPEAVRQFVQGVSAGDRFAYARVSEHAGEIPSLRLVLLAPGMSIGATNQYYCAKQAGFMAALRLELPGKS